MFGGQYLGITLGGGGAIYVSSFWGFNASIIYISCMLLMSLLFVIVFIEDPAVRSRDADSQSGNLAHFFATLRGFIGNLYTGFVQSGNGPKLGLLFAILPVGAMALAYAILGTLQVDYGLDQGAIARISILNTTFAGAGCIIGGMLGDRQGIVAEGMGYATVLYLDAMIVVAALALIPFLKNRDEHAEDRGTGTLITT